jgi:preprotein translocase subunit SecE
VADGDKVDPADEPDTAATPDEPVESESGENGDGSDERELVTAGSAARSASKDPTEAGARGRSKKEKATPKQKGGAVEHKRTGPVTFVRQSVGELRKVVYPTGPQLANYFVVVLIFVLFIIAYVTLLDLGIGAAIFRIFA